METLNSHTRRVNDLAFDASGRMLASASRDGSVAIWSVTAETPGWVQTRHDLDVFAVVFNPEAPVLYSGSRDQTVRVWDVRDGSEMDTIGGHGQFVTALALSPDHNRLALASWFGDLVLLDTKTGDAVASFTAHEAAVRGAAFSPDGQWLATGGYGGDVRLFDALPRTDRNQRRAEAEDALARGRLLAASALAASPDPSAALRRLTAEATGDDAAWATRALLELAATRR